MTMTIPFLQYFKRKAVTERSVVAPVEPVPVEKPSSERLSKTVLPNSTRTLDESFPAARSGVGFSTNGGALPPAVALALEPTVERVISLDLADVVAQMPAGLIRPLHDGDGSRRVLLKAVEIEKGMASARP